jgi:hypothetical protein
MSERYIERLVGRALVALARLLAVADADVPEAAPAPRVAERRATRERHRARWAEMYADGLIDRQTMRARLAAVDADLAALPSGPPPSTRWDAAALAAFASAAATWGTLTDSARRAILLAYGLTIEVTSHVGEARGIRLVTPQGLEVTASYSTRYRERGKGRRA